MDIITQTNTYRLMREIMNMSVSSTPIIPSIVQKAPFLNAKQNLLKRVNPNTVGLESKYIESYLRELTSNPKTCVHTVTILRNSNVIAQSSVFPYKADVWHVTHSLCKSITGLCIGMLIDDGLISLDDKISKFYSKSFMFLSSLRTKGITIRELLTMSSGIAFNEAGIVTERDWQKAFFESRSKFEPGAQFSYNSMNSYMLSAIVNIVCGKTMSDFLEERLFAKMGITNFFWEKCPKGIEKGGMGLYMLPEDMAKIGLLYLQKGFWNGEQLVSESWCKVATTAQIEVPGYIGDYDYGYHAWVKKGKDSFLLNGMFGQNVMVYPRNGIIVAITAGNNDMFQANPFFEITDKYFERDFSARKLLINPFKLYSLRKFEASLARRADKKQSFLEALFHKENLYDKMSFCDGKVIELNKSKGSAVGVLPLITQVIQNNYTKGIERLIFNVESKRMIVRIEEADESHDIPVGYSCAEYSTQVFHGESYEVAAFADFVYNEDNMPVLKISLNFLEVPNSRMIKIFFENDVMVTTKWSENPNRDFIAAGIKVFFNNSVDFLSQDSGDENVNNKNSSNYLKVVFDPEVNGHFAN